MNASILYICTGRYTIFWEQFYQSCEANFLPEANKTYFVFTDSQKLDQREYPNARFLHQDNLGWPDIALDRAKILLRVEKEVQSTDYAFFFNANIVFPKKIEAHEVVSDRRDDLTVVNHPGFYDKQRSEYTFEENPISAAYIDPGSPAQGYFAGGIFGGRPEAFYAMARECMAHVEQDRSHGIVALWHDESHFNRYANRRTVKILSPAYGYPEGWKLPFEAKVLILDKAKLGGHQYLRCLSDTPIEMPPQHTTPPNGFRWIRNVASSGVRKMLTRVKIFHE